MNDETVPTAPSPAAAPSRVGAGRRWAIMLVIALLVYLTWPSPIDPIAVEVKPAPALEGPLAANELLRTGERWAEGKVHGPEDIEFDSEGRVYAATADGKIIRLLPNGTIEDWATGLGRPLGMDFAPNGRLIVCDGLLGLLAIDPSGKHEVLVDAKGDWKVGFADDCEVSKEGVVYFSDASDKFGVGKYTLDLLEGRPHGRLLSYQLADGKTEVLADGLHFANGVALAPDEEYILVNETYRYRVARHWLKGDKAGTTEIIADNLPGFPDGISTSPRGTYWVAMFTLRNAAADRMAGWPWVRKQMAKLPSAFLPQPAEYGLVIELDGDGNILRSLHDPGGVKISNVTSAKESEGTLWLGNLLKDYAAKVSLKEE